MKLKRFGIPTKTVIHHLSSRGLTDAGEIRGMTQKIELIEAILSEPADTNIVASLQSNFRELTT